MRPPSAAPVGGQEGGPAPVDVVVAGHVCLDLVCKVATQRLALEPGSLAEIHGTRLATGGAVANTGLALLRLGVATRLMGAVGDDLLGAALRDALVRNGADDTRGIAIVSGASTSYTLVLTPPGGERMFLHEPGTYADFDAAAVDLDLVEGARLFHFGYPPLLPRFYADGGRPLAALLAAVRQRGVAVSLDMAMPDPASPAGRVDWREVLERSLPHTDLFMPSFDETLVLLRDAPREGEAPDPAAPGERGRRAQPARVSRLAGELLTMGAGMVLFKMGSEGVYLRTAAADRLRAIGPATPPDLEAWADRELWSPSLQTEVVNTVGAGDATCAGFIAALLRRLAPEEALSVAAAVGAYCVEAPDASGGGPSWEACRTRLDAGWAHNPLELRGAGWRRDESTTLWRGPHDRPS